MTATVITSLSYIISSIILHLAPRMPGKAELIKAKAMPGGARVCRSPRKTSPTRSGLWIFPTRTASETILPGRPKYIFSQKGGAY
eukprot:15873934-Heterocapsa_arctica.AAC.1